jgi:hypothetical protein
MDDFDMRQRDREYSNGGGGSGNHGYVRRQVFSRQCYSDPNNPEKMICKEINDTSGYNPFTNQETFRNRNENLYEEKGIFGRM